LTKSLLVLSALAVSAFGATINTGTATWQVSTTGVGGAYSAVVNEVGTPIVNGGWVQNPVGSEWVGTTATDGQFGTTGGLPGTYVYRLAIGAVHGGPGSFVLNYAADNGINLYIGNLAGTVLANVASCGPGDGDAVCFTSFRNASGVFGASDYLYAVVVNGGTARNPTGLLVVGETSVIPEPSTYAMLALGGAALAFARLRRK
jgi:hypothetical protein